MIDNKRVCSAPSQRQLTACARAVILLLYAFATLESKEGVAQEPDGAKPVVYVVAMAAIPTDETPVNQPVVTDVSGGTVYAVAAIEPTPEASEGVASTPSAAPVAREPEAPAKEIVAQAPKEEMNASSLAPASGLGTAPTAVMPAPVSYSSPLRTIRFDRVDNLSNRVALDVQRGGDGTVTYKVTVPLKLLDLNVSPGMTIAGDIGVLRGNGFETLQRAYWSNKAGGLVSDLPGEAELTPNLWGRFRFVSAYE